MKSWILPKTEKTPDSPKYPTADFAHEMAATVAKAKKRKKKSKGKKLDGVDLEV